MPLPEETRNFALWKKEGRTTIVGLTWWNHVWQIDAATGEARQITTRQLAPSELLQPSEEGGVSFRGFVVSQSENRAVCFARTGQCFVVDLVTGAAWRRQLPAPLRERGVSFARRCEKTGRYLVLSEDVPCGGHHLFVLDFDFEETASTAIMGDPFIDAAFSPDGSHYATLTASGLVQIHDGERTRTSPQPLPALGNYGIHCASIVGWR